MSEEQSFLDMALDEVPDLKAVPGDQEYKLRVTSVKHQVSKGEKTAGQELLLMYFDIAEHSDTRPISYPIMLPSDQLSVDENNDRKRQLKRVLQAMEWDISKGFSPDELVGQELFAILGTEVSADYGEQNKIKSFIVPK